MAPHRKISLEDLRFFVTVACAETLAAAARSQDVTPSAVTQRLRQLEGRLHLRLIDRTTRGLRLTDEGQLLLDRARNVLEDLDDITETLSARRGVVGGHLRIIAPLGFGRRYVAPLAAVFRRENPDVKLTLVLTERPALAMEDTWDIAIHIGELRDSSRILHALAPNERFLCAAPAYLQQHGEPSSPDQLVDHHFIALRQNDEDVTLMQFEDARGNPFNIRMTSMMSSNDGESSRLWAEEGHGIILRSEWDVAEDLKAGRLLRLLPDYHLPSAHIVALLSTRSEKTARVSEFLRLMKMALTPVPWRLP
ncbi:LysR substrate-binding domain-containing protein [Kordiimonas pumila]|uniref:LysR substrate-binding domain-containing protein n=1 Tax=Kordiimonas pumila TaxID=2161677 RepID=A0ABV7D4R3_9PROT|nr:LysR substrate-binding domain-containing protein [Kordiimonas pumila]